MQVVSDAFLPRAGGIRFEMMNVVALRFHASPVT